MVERPKLSICVPSRNRQPHFQTTIAGLVATDRRDVEFVFADNSDEPHIMRDFFNRCKYDDRIMFLPSEAHILSMRDNWERTVAAARGDWIVVIGDDDHVTPELAGVLARVEKEEPELDVLAWQRVNWNWPDARSQRQPIFVPLDNRIVRIEQSELAQHYFGWSHRLYGPTLPFSIYHSAVSRDLMERIRQTYSGRYFEHECVDYDNFSKVIALGSRFMLCSRPLSITGTCARANSAGIGKLKAFNAVNSRTFSEAGRNLNDDPFYAGFPFTFELGVPAYVARCQYWFKKTYGFRYEGWEANFVAGCRSFCSAAHDREMFDLLVSGFKTAFARWKGGRYAALFGQPSFIEASVRPTGVFREGLWMDEDVASVSTPAELFRLLDQLLADVHSLEIGGWGLLATPGDKKNPQESTGRTQTLRKTA